MGLRKCVCVTELPRVTLYENIYYIICDIIMFVFICFLSIYKYIYQQAHPEVWSKPSLINYHLLKKISTKFQVALNTHTSLNWKNINQNFLVYHKNQRKKSQKTAKMSWCPPCPMEFSRGNGTGVAEAVGNWGFSNEVASPGHELKRIECLLERMEELWVIYLCNK